MELLASMNLIHDPHHFPSGIEYVLVNGIMVLEKEKLTGQLPGRWIKRGYN